MSEAHITEKENMDRKLDKSTLNKTWFTWICFGQICYNYERMMGLGFTHAMTHVFKKLYGNNKEKIADGLTRHMTFYNTENTWGSMIAGIVASLEEKRAQGQDVDEEGISGIKTALMGPIAGIGDSITQALVKVILLAIAVDFALQGNAIGVIIFVVGFSLYALLVSRWMFFSGYKVGQSSVVNLLKGDRIKNVTSALGAVGMMVLGALVANNLRVTTRLKFQIGQSITEVQPMLDTILPKFLNVVAFMLVYWLLKRKMKANTIILVIFGAAIVLSLLGIL